MHPLATPILATVTEGGTLASIEETINSIFEPITYWATTIIFYSVPVFGTETPLVTFWLVAAGLITTIYYGGIQFRGFKTSLEVVRGKYSHEEDAGEVTHFQALSSALSGTVGLGNIAGVGVAVTLGGPGATFWMILAGLLGMATKFAEVTLGVKYREIHEDGTVTGGPFRYLPIAYGKIGKIPAKVMTALYAVAIFLFGVAGGNMFQSNQTFAQARNVTGGEDGPLGSAGASFVFGLILAGLVAVVIIGGIKSIGRVTSKLVPAMAAIYVIGALIVIFANVTQVPEAVVDIITGAFNPSSVAGGAIGVLIVGFQRAAFSNEAGLGSAAIAHAAVKTRRPVSEGFVALLEPFVDTVIICTMTALTIVIAAPPLYVEAQQTVFEGGAAPDGVVVTSSAFDTVIPGFPIILAIAVALFAFSTLITWSYYGLKAWTTLFGRSPFLENLYKVIFCFFTVTGAVLTFGEVLSFADAMLFLCAFINLIGVYMLLPVIKSEMREYLADRKSGVLAREGAEPPKAREVDSRTGLVEP